MKTKLLFILCCLPLFILYAKPITIKGHIEGALPENLYYTAPVNGSLEFDIYYTAPVDAKGNFEITTDSNEATFIDIYYNYKPAGCFIVQPGGQYGIIITESGGKITFDITGTEAALHKRYNTLVDTYRIVQAINLAREALKNESSPQKLKAFFDDKLKSDLTVLDVASLPKDIRELLNRERVCFYAVALDNAILLKHIGKEREKSGRDLSGYDALWKELYKEHSPGGAFIKKLPLGYTFLKGYRGYKLYEAAGFDGTKIQNNNSLLEYYRQGAALMPAQNAEYYFAAGLYSSIYEGQKEESAIAAYNYFKEQYPNSGYIPCLEPKMAPIISFFAESSALPEDAELVEDYASINTVEELIKKFKGYKLYFDVWATWCGPCREEFKYKDELYRLLGKHGVSVIYISIDDDDKHETWLKMIGLYGLEGYHIRANPELNKDLRKLFNNNGSMLIPWYILVDKDGAIAAKHAPPPSDMGKLEAAVNKI